MANNVINVPLHSIARDLDTSISSAVLAVSAFVIVLAVAMPITGWVGDRFGRRRILLAALLLMMVGQLLAAVAPSLPLLIGARAVQGLACSAIPPMVMGMLVTFFPGRRLQMMGAWAAANGVGQALGPPIGGVVADAVGWRPLFLIIALASVTTLVVIARAVPPVPGVQQRFDLAGASLLSTGMALLLVALTAVSLPGPGLLVMAGAAAVGFGLLAAFVVVSSRNPAAMLPPHLLLETRFLRSCVAAFVQMFMLGCVLVGVPLYLTGELGMSTWQTGVLFFQLPLVMFLLAPVVGRVAARTQPRLILRIGLATLVAGGLLAALVTGVPSAPANGFTVSAVLIVLGVGMACVQTPAAAGATRSPAGARGAALGVFNMLRFSGSAAGTAWVAIAYAHAGLLTLFLVASAVAALGLWANYLGPNPQDVSGAEPVPAT
jgi:MFS family permease